jgi:hypothetical protein
MGLCPGGVVFPHSVPDEIPPAGATSLRSDPVGQVNREWQVKREYGPSKIFHFYIFVFPSSAFEE